MAEKAVVTGVRSIVRQRRGIFEFTVAADVTVDNTQVEVLATVRTAGFTPADVSAWRTSIKDEVMAVALAELNVVVDAVMFQDFSVLGV